ncbi:MAG: proline dehydrogenase, partial [Chitinophagaceae bacterium]
MISFNNTQTAFAYKNDADLKSAHFLFKMMGNSTMVKLGLNLIPGAIKINFPFAKGLIKSTIFRQFVGGETLSDTIPVVNKLAQHKVQVILDYGVEGGHNGEKGFDESTEQFIRVIDFAATQPNIPFMSIKMTGIVRFSLLEMIDTGMHAATGSLSDRYRDVLAALPQSEQQEWGRVVERLKRICITARDKRMGVLIDAEETWIQDPVDALTLLMMEEFNKESVIVFNTYQLYRHDRLSFLKENYETAKKQNFKLGAKLVRGAYMEKERERAREKKYPSPIQPDKTSCDRDYNDAVDFCIDRLDAISLIVASHNEQSNQLAASALERKGIPKDHPHIHFSQLFGMSDHITFNMAAEGYPVSKYLPFGPIGDVIPYLMRRAEENSSVA